MLTPSLNTLLCACIVTTLAVACSEESDDSPSTQGADVGASTDDSAAGGGGGVSDFVFYVAAGEECCGEDPHPVHGVETPDGGFVLCGKIIDAKGGSDGFVMKLSPPFPAKPTLLGEGATYTWSQSFGTPAGKDLANSVVATKEGVFVVGAEQTADGSLAASLRKYDLGSGALVWAKTFASPSPGTDAAYESARLTASGDVVVGGFVNGAKGAAEGFKSYGNPTSGQGQISLFSKALLAAATPPDEVTWSQIYPKAGSIRSVIEAPGGGYAFVAPTATDVEVYQVILTDADGATLTTTELSEHGEATDIAALSQDGQHTGYAVSGHKHGGVGGIDGSVTKLDKAGKVLWRKSVGNPVGGVGAFAGLGAGNPKLIYDECWGVQSDEKGGAVLACGTGIEGCDGWTKGSAIHSECVADPRQKWRGLLVGVNGEGEQLWSRTDSFPAAEGGGVAASASEHVIRTKDGGYASVVDQDFGVGLLLIAAP